jgi:hypothetical protein
MNFTINRQLLNTAIFDSGALGPLTSLVHQFSSPGIYVALVRHNGKTAHETRFEVSTTSTNMQLNIDLATPTIDLAKSAGCDCEKGALAQLPSVSPNGYVLFHASTGSGYSVVAGLGSDKPVFDSAKLEKGDLFALSLMEPTSYAMSNSLGKAKGEITVSFSKEDVKRLSSLETQMVDVSKNDFKPASLKLLSTQGLVFRVQESARIVVERTGAVSEKTSRQKTRIQLR